MLEVTYINQDGASVILRQIKPFFITRIDGAGRIRQTINTFHAPEQDGEFYISPTLDMRNITLEGNILAESIEESFLFRQRLLKIFTPNVNEHERQFMSSSTHLRSKSSGTLVYRNLQISCIVEEAGFTVSNVSRAPAFFISLLCPSPFFESLNDIRAELASWQENFQFPLEITPPGIELGIRQPSQIITIENIGDVSCGCEVVFKALGTVTNPELRNLDTGEYIKINTTMENGEEIHVFTHFAGKRVTQIIGTTETNAFALLDVGSTFLQLFAGRNTLRYDAEENMDLLEVSIYYRPQFLGV